jgi:hypothetical protein
MARARLNTSGTSSATGIDPSIGWLLTGLALLTLCLLTLLGAGAAPSPAGMRRTSPAAAAAPDFGI